MPIVQRLEPGTLLELEINFVELDKPIPVIGEIVWLKERKDVQFPFEIGIKFVKIDPAGRKEIMNIFKKEPTEIKWID